MLSQRTYIALFRVQSARLIKKTLYVDSVLENGALAQLARAPALQAGCQGFESLMLHQFFGRIAQLVRARP